MRSFIQLVLTAAAVCEVSPGFAQDAGRAEETFRDGRALLKDKRYSEACPKFEESQREDPASGTLLALAYCQELSGRFASAWLSYTAAIDLAKRENQSERAQMASARAGALEPRLSTVTVVVSDAAAKLPNFRVKLDQLELDRATWGKPLQQDGGTHHLEASAAGRRGFSQTINLGVERDQQVAAVPPLDLAEASIEQQNLPASAAFQAQTPSQRDNVLKPANEARENPSARPLMTASLAFAVASAASLGAGLVFGLVANSKNNRSNQDGHCDSRGCDPRGTELRNQALSAANTATIAFAIGSALGAGSLTLYLIGNSSSGAPAQPVMASVAPRMASLSLKGTF